MATGKVPGGMWLRTSGASGPGWIPHGEGTHLFSWISAGFSDRGAVREVNEDSFVDVNDKGVWVVADGMGGHDDGRLASTMICDRLARVDGAVRTVDLLDNVEDELIDLNRELFRLAGGRETLRTIGSTVVALVALQKHAVCLWAGDSRVYRYRSGVLEQVTKDHSELQALIEKGLIREDDGVAAECANVITRAIGGEPEVVLDAEIRALGDGDRYLLCSDGLYREMSTDELESHLSSPSAESACRALEKTAALRTCADNVTAIVVDFHDSV